MSSGKNHWQKNGDEAGRAEGGRAEGRWLLLCTSVVVVVVVVVAGADAGVAGVAVEQRKGSIDGDHGRDLKGGSYGWESQKGFR